LFWLLNRTDFILSIGTRQFSTIGSKFRALETAGCS